eukprot:jgi/Tetstr1/442288/TSEL_030429.t1
MEDETLDQLRFMDGELARFLASGAWEEGNCYRWVSLLFLVIEPDVNKWRLNIDMQPLNRYCEEQDLCFETLLTRLRHLARPGDYMPSMAMHDGVYAVGIASKHRNYCTVDYRGKLYRLVGLFMVWSLSLYYFCSAPAARQRPARSGGSWVRQAKRHLPRLHVVGVGNP